MPLPLPIDIETLVRIVAVGVLVLYVWPRYALVTGRPENGWDAAVGNAAQMMVVLILTGYATAALHAFGWLSLVAVLLALRLVRPSQNASEYQLRPSMRLAARLLEELDRLGGWPSRAWAALRARHRRNAVRRPIPPAAVLGGCAAVAVFGVAAWMRLAVPFAHAAIPFADSSQTLALTQGIQQQHLFLGGVYPQGFYILIADMVRLSAANPVVAAKFLGPLNGVLLVASVGFATYRSTGRVAPAVLAMLVYGTLPRLLPYDSLRQVGLDAESLGNALVLPTLWFVYAAWRRPEAWWRISALALITAAALIQPLAAINVVLAAIAATVGAWLTPGTLYHHLRWLVHWLPRALLVAVTPIAIGIAAGISLQAQSAASPVVAQHQPSPPELVPIVAAAGVLLLLLVRLRTPGRGDPLHDGAGLPLAGLTLLAAALAVQHALPAWFDSRVLENRSGELVALAEALCLGLGLAGIWEALSSIGERTAEWLALAAALAALGYGWAVSSPAPLDALSQYRWVPDDYVAAFVGIGSSLPRKSWLAVGDESGFGYAYGQGFFMSATDFSAHVRAAERWLAFTVPGHSPNLLPETRIFFFVDKRIVVGPAYRRGAVPRRTRQQASLRSWLAAWQRSHGPLPIYFDGPDLIVYEMVRPGTAPVPAVEGAP